MAFGYRLANSHSELLLDGYFALEDAEKTL